MKSFLSIGGIDTGGGAGINADLKIAKIFNFNHVCVITAITYQNSCKIDDVLKIDSLAVKKQLETILSDYDIAGIKISLVMDKDQVKVIKNAIKRIDSPKVLDPILKSSTGYEFVESKIYEELFRTVDVITPNAEEASIISGFKILNVDDAKKCAKYIKDEFGCDVIITGGSLGGKDIIFNGEYHFIDAEVSNITIHGTGCIYSMSLGCSLAKGRNLLDSARIARIVVLESVKRAKKAGKCLLFADPPLSLNLL